MSVSESGSLPSRLVLVSMWEPGSSRDHSGGESGGR